MRAIVEMKRWPPGCFGGEGVSVKGDRGMVERERRKGGRKGRLLRAMQMGALP